MRNRTGEIEEERQTGNTGLREEKHRRETEKRDREERQRQRV